MYGLDLAEVIATAALLPLPLSDNESSRQRRESGKGVCQEACIQWYASRTMVVTPLAVRSSHGLNASGEQQCKILHDHLTHCAVLWERMAHLEKLRKYFGKLTSPKHSAMLKMWKGLFYGSFGSFSWWQ